MTLPQMLCAMAMGSYLLALALAAMQLSVLTFLQDLGVIR